MQGKSLSLICGALKWLVDHEEHHKKKLEAVLSGSVSPSALCQKDSDSEGAHASIFAGTETKTANGEVCWKLTMEKILFVRLYSDTIPFF